MDGAFGRSTSIDSISPPLQNHGDDTTQGSHHPTPANINSGPVNEAHIRHLNPRSCVTCRRRKVKCDKTHPCKNCTRQQIECVYPSPWRAPRKPRKATDPRDVELLSRLRRLEAVVKRMGVDSVTEERASAQDTDIRQPDLDPSIPPLVHHDSHTSQESTRDRDEDTSPRVGPLETRFGRLVVNEGKSRYINNSFWANLSTEVEDLKGILNRDTDDDDDDVSSPPTFEGKDHSWIFRFSSQKVDLLSLHPPPVQIATYWAIHKENVDPLVKLLHIPSIEPTVLASASHLANLSKAFEALMFSIYYGVATSLSNEDCIIRLGEERHVLLTRYEFAVEQSLARANFLITEEVVTLQAFILYLICLRRNSAARIIWTLTGLVVRIAQTIGVHRDGEHFNLTPFEIEMRRRLWWQVCILDVRASEDHGCDPTITEQTFDTKMPLNVNDSDLDPRMKVLPKERIGGTDMTFSLIRFEVANTLRRLTYVPPRAPRTSADALTAVSLEEKERWINDCHQRLENKYLMHCDIAQPIYWVTTTVARLMMTKMWLMVYHPFQRQDGGKRLSSEIKEKLFITSLENIEYSLLLQTEARTLKWGWLFKTYVQWHAFAFILVELCHRTRGDLVDRAWIAVENSKDARWGEMMTRGHSNHLWRPLNRLVDKARAARKKALMEDQVAMLQRGGAHQPVTQSVGMNVTSSSSSAGSSNKPTMMRAPLSAASIERFMSPPTYGMSPSASTHLMRLPRSDSDPIVRDDNTTDLLTLMSEQQTPSEDQGDTTVPLVFEILDQQRIAAASRAAQLHAQNPAFDTASTSLYGAGAVDMNTMTSSNTGSSGAQHVPQPLHNKSISPPNPFAFNNAPQLSYTDPGVTSTTMDTTSNANNAQQPELQNHQSDEYAQRPELPTQQSDESFTFDAQTGEVDWGSWDELVRQFGMDVDPPAGGGFVGPGVSVGQVGGGGEWSWGMGWVGVIF